MKLINFPKPREVAIPHKTAKNCCFLQQLPTSIGGCFFVDEKKEDHTVGKYKKSLCFLLKIPVFCALATSQNLGKL